MATILGIESTCDETAASIVVDGRDVRSNVIATQFDLHAKYRGVVPEIASRAHIENILPVLQEAAACGFANQPPPEKQNSFLQNIDAIAVAHRPGLIGSLLIGVTAAKTLAWSLGKPLIAIDHVHAHLYSVMLEETQNTECRTMNGGEDNSSLRSSFPDFPAIGLVCSGGHTALYKLNSWKDVQLIGSTIDDAVGEAYDKVAAILNLGYPGGPILDELATKGDPNAIKFPRTFLNRDSLDFSFSGLKTAVLYHVRGVPSRRNENNIIKPPPTESEIHDIAASFQSACIDVIVEKLHRAVAQFGAKSIIIGGGVSANRGLRAALSTFPIPVFFPNLRYCTDNAAMIAGLADIYYQAKEFASLYLDAITYSRFRGAL